MAQHLRRLAMNSRERRGLWTPLLHPTSSRAADETGALRAPAPSFRIRGLPVQCALDQRVLLVLMAMMRACGRRRRLRPAGVVQLLVGLEQRREAFLEE